MVDRQSMPTPTFSSSYHVSEGVKMTKEELNRLAVGYIRVSTKGQDGEAGSLEQQAARVRDYALLKGFTLTGIYEDVASAMPGKPDARPEFQDAINSVSRDKAFLIVTEVDRLSRSLKEVTEQIIAPRIPVHVVSLNRLVGRKRLLDLARQAELTGGKIGTDTKAALAGKKSRGASVGATAKTLRKATESSLRTRSMEAWKTVTDIAIFISADSARQVMKRRELVEALNTANIKTTRGNPWTIGALTRSLRKAREHLALQNEADDGPAGFDNVLLTATRT